MYNKNTILLLLVFIVNVSLSQELIIQEEEAGFCFVDGIFESSVAGYTGSGYANPDAGVGVSMAWNVLSESGGTYVLKWRYALGGNIGDRPAKLLINGIVTILPRILAHGEGGHVVSTSSTVGPSPPWT